MIFPIQYCVKTNNFGNNVFFNKFVDKLVSDGYYNPTKTSKLDSLYFDMYTYIGVNQHGDIMLYDNNVDYIDPCLNIKDNILSKTWLKKYLFE